MKKLKIEILTNELGCAKCETAIKKIRKVAKLFKNLEIIKTDVTKNPQRIIDNSIMTTLEIFLSNKLEFEGPINEFELKKKILNLGGIPDE